MAEITNGERSRWRARLGWTALVFGLLERIVGWGGSIDFIVSRSEDPGWIRDVLTFLRDYSAYFGFLLILIGVFFIVWNERRRVDAILHARIPTTVPGEAPKPQTLGHVTTVAAATVRDPTTEEILQRGLYVGRMIVGTTRLKKENLLEITACGFNGANRIVTVADVSGHIIAAVPDTKGLKKQLELPTPAIIRNPSENYGKFTEFNILLNQHVAPAQARAILRALGNETVAFTLSALTITVTPLGEAGPRVRLPLWDGVTLLPGTDVQTGRIVNAVGRATMKARAGFGGPQQPEGTEVKTQQ